LGLLNTKKEIDKDKFVDELESDDDLEDNLPPIVDDDSDFTDDIDDDFSAGSSLESRNPELLKQLMNFDPFIKDKINGWLGLVWSERDKIFKPNKHIRPIMNIFCANWCSTFVQTYTRNTNVMANITTETFNNIMTDASKILIYNIYPRMEEFGIKEIGDAERVINELLHSSEILLCSIGGGKMADVISKNVTRSEHVNLTDGGSNTSIQTPKSNGFSKFINKMVGDR